MLGTSNPNYPFDIDGDASLGNNFFVRNSDDVGIGTSSPNKDLEVVGDGNITDNLEVGKVYGWGNGSGLLKVNDSSDSVSIIELGQDTTRCKSSLDVGGGVGSLI